MSLPDFVAVPISSAGTAVAEPQAAVARRVLTCVTTITHRHPAGNPTHIDCRFSELLQSDEHPYARPFKVGQEWKEIDTAWIEEASLLVVQNPKISYAMQPSQEQKEFDDQRILELAYPDSPPWLIRPGRIFIAEPSDLAGLRIRSQQGTAEVMLTAIPR